jgi:hypothetical protein
MEFDTCSERADQVDDPLMWPGHFLRANMPGFILGSKLSVGRTAWFAATQEAFNWKADCRAH